MNSHQDKDPRGPLRTIKTVTASSSCTLVTYVECDHTGEMNQIYSYRVGDSSRCFKCRVR